MVSAGVVVALASGATLLSVILVAFILLVVYIHYMHCKYSHIPGPKRKSFFLGNIPDFRWYIAEGKLIDDAVKDWGDEFGPVLVVWFLHRCMVYFFDAQNIRELLVSGSLTYVKGWTYDGISAVYGARFLGQGLVTEKEHNVWFKRREIFNPAFARSYLKTCISQFNSSSDLLVQYMRPRADGKTVVSLLDVLNKATIDIIAKVAFGSDFHQFNPAKVTSFDDEFTTTLQGIKAQFEQPWIKYSPMRSAREHREKVRKSIGVLRDTGRAIIQRQINSLARGNQLGNNILSFILESSQHSANSQLDLEKMVDDFTTFFLAGNETTANLLASAVLELSQHPECMYRLKTEVDAVLADKEFILYEDLSKLEYMVAVLKETLRLHPPASGTARTSITDTVIGGYKIPANTSLGVSFYAVQRTDKYWQNAQEFIPDRFLHGDESATGAFLPFSIGPRNCIGQQFALTRQRYFLENIWSVLSKSPLYCGLFGVILAENKEKVKQPQNTNIQDLRGSLVKKIEARVLLAKLLQNYNFSLVPGQSLQFVVETTLKPKDKCQVFITPVGEPGQQSVINDINGEVTQNVSA